MKKAGFTMIELIFVIVVLGILAAVALPKFLGLSEQAKAGKCKAFYGTLSRTVGPAIWSNMILNEINETEAFTPEAFSEQIEIPDDCTNDVNQSWKNIVKLAVEGTTFKTDIAGEEYEISGSAATNDAAPKWEWKKTKD